MSGVLVVLLAVLAIAAIAYYGYVQKQRRIALLRGFAASQGWHYSESDNVGLANRWSARPFGKGYDRTARNLLTGTHHDRPFVAFDYSYKEDTGSGKDRHTTTYRYSCVALTLPVPLPQLDVSPETILTRLGNAVLGNDIELESEDFNRAFRVRAEDAKFACDVLTPRTMERLLAAEHVAWHIEGTDVVCHEEGSASIPEILGRLALLEEVVAGVPGFVWHDRGATDPGPPGLAGRSGEG